MQRIPGAELSSRVALQNCWSLCLWHLTGRWKDRSPSCTQGFGCSQSISGHITPSPKLTFPLWSNQVTLRVVLDDFAPYWPKTYFTDNAKQWMSSSHCLYTDQLSYSHNIWLHCMLLPLLYLKKNNEVNCIHCPAGKTASRSRCTEIFPFMVAVFSFSNDLLVNVGFKLSTLKNIKRAHPNSLAHFFLKINNYYSFKKELNSFSTQVLHFRAYTVFIPWHTLGNLSSDISPWGLAEYILHSFLSSFFYSS